MPIRVQLHPYDPGLGELVRQSIEAGYKVTELADIIGVPYSTVLQWRREHASFDRRLRMALQGRALAYEEKSVEAEKDEVPAARLRFDAYRAAAQWDDPSRYGNKV